MGINLLPYVTLYAAGVLMQEAEVQDWASVQM
jgi:hypothetical protein